MLPLRFWLSDDRLAVWGVGIDFAVASVQMLQSMNFISGLEEE